MGDSIANSLRTLFGRHPFAMMVTAAFLYAVVVTMLYLSGVIPGVRRTDLGSLNVTTITVILLVATVASWITSLVLSPDGR